MADIVEEVFTEEVDVGSSASSGSSSVTTDEFSFGQTPVAEPVAVATESEQKNTTSLFREGEIYTPVSTPATIVSKSSVVAATEDMVTLDNLRAVSAQFTSGCKSFNDIVEGTGLSTSVVKACLDFMRSNGIAPLVAQSGAFYCSINNVSSFQEQLKTCIQCHLTK